MYCNRIPLSENKKSLCAHQKSNSVVFFRYNHFSRIIHFKKVGRNNFSIRKKKKHKRASQKGNSKISKIQNNPESHLKRAHDKEHHLLDFRIRAIFPWVRFISKRQPYTWGNKATSEAFSESVVRVLEFKPAILSSYELHEIPFRFSAETLNKLIVNLR